MIHVIVKERNASALATSPITTGSVGLTVRLAFSEDWDGLGKVVTFRGSGEQIDVALTGEECSVPPEVLVSAGGRLMLGVYGTDGEERVTPTIWADAGIIQEGAEPSGIEPSPQTASLVDQILAAAQAAQDAAEDAQETAQSVRDDADAGSFNGPRGPAGYSPTVTVTDIEGGHRVTITDATHPAGQSFDVLDGESGSGGSGIGYVGYGEDSYADIQDMLGADLLPICIYDGLQLQYIGETELAGDLGFLFAAYDPNESRMVSVTCWNTGQSQWAVGFAEIPNAATLLPSDRPKMDGTVSAGSSDRYARADHVHPKDTAKLDVDQGAANAGKFLVVGADGNITAVTMAAWQGGAY